MKSFLKISVVILISFLMLITLAGLLIIRIYGDDIKNLVIKNLNKELSVKVEINDSNVSFFRSFPFISIVLSDVTAYSNEALIKDYFSEINPDILFEARKIFIQFSLIRILKKDFEIKRLVALEGNLQMLTDPDGNNNYQLFSRSRTSSKISHNIHLDHFKLKQFTFLLLNKYKNSELVGRADELFISGRFSRKKLNLYTRGSFVVMSFHHEGISYADNMNISAKLNFTADESVYNIDKGIISVNDLRLETSGKIKKEENIHTELIIKGKNLGIKSLINVFPENFRKNIKQYSPEGKSDIKISINGSYSGTEMPVIKSDFSVIRGSLKLLNRKGQIKNISLSGNYTNGELQDPISSSLVFNEVYVQMNESVLRGKIEISNLASPMIVSAIKGNINVTDLNTLLDNNIINLIEGELTADLVSLTNLTSFREFDLNTILVNDMRGDLSLRNISYQYNKNYPDITDLSGRLEIREDTWLSDIRFTIGSSDLHFRGNIEHILRHYLQKSPSIRIHGDVYSDYSDLSFLFNNQQIDETSGGFILPDNLFLKLNLLIKQFKLNKFSAGEFMSELSYKPGMLSVTSLNFNTMKGELKGYGGFIQDTDGNLNTKVSGRLNNIDITEMFEIFNNFRQEFIKSNNLRGMISGSVDFSANLNAAFELLPESIYAESNVTIEKGELKDFIPLRNLSRFIELSELEHVKFETLSNNIIIKNEQVLIPTTDIHSSAFNLALSGIHGFDNNFEYSVKVNLSEILAKKARLKKENNEFSVLEKDGQRVNIFLNIAGTPDDFRIRYDRKEAVNQIKQDLKSEKQNIKYILFEEFGLFKKQFSDSTIIRSRNEESVPGFIFEWDEGEKSPEKNKNNTVKRETGSKKREYNIVID